MSVDNKPSRACRIAVLTRPQSPTGLGRVFEQILKMHKTDAMQLARRAPGLLPEPFSAEQAPILVAAIRGIGLEACQLRPEEVPDLDSAMVVHHVKCLESGLQLFELHGQPELLIPWSALQMICIGEIPLETFRHYQTDPMTGFTAGHHYRPSSIDSRRSAGLEGWIMCRAPFPILRIEHQNMNYEYLESRKTDSATTNFRCLVDDLLRHATDVVLTDSTRAYLSHDRLVEYSFASQEELQHYATWQSIVVQAAVPAGADGRSVTQPVSGRFTAPVQDTAKSIPNLIYHCRNCGKVVELQMQPVPLMCCQIPMEIVPVNPVSSSAGGAT